MTNTERIIFYCPHCETLVGLSKNFSKFWCFLTLGIYLLYYLIKKPNRCNMCNAKISRKDNKVVFSSDTSNSWKDKIKKEPLITQRIVEEPVKPYFFVDERGQIYCKSHTNFPSFESYINELNENLSREELTLLMKKRRKISLCLTCNHYVHNTCFISNSKINKVRLGINFRLYRCSLCGSAIDNIHYVLYKKFTKQEHNVKIPLLCCECHVNLQQKDVKEAFRKTMKGFIIVCVGSFGCFFFLAAFIYFFIDFKQYPYLITLLIPGVAISLGPGLLYLVKIVKLKISMKKSGILKEFLKKRD